MNDDIYTLQPQRIVMYAVDWCPDCRRAKQFLGEHQIPYRWIDIEQDPEGEKYVLQRNNGKRIIPTLEFPDGSILVEPTNAELAAKLGLKTKAKRSHYDLVVVGGGPAGLTAALYASREGMDTLVIERAAMGGQALPPALASCSASSILRPGVFIMVWTPPRSLAISCSWSSILTLLPSLLTLVTVAPSGRLPRKLERCSASGMRSGEVTSKVDSVLGWSLLTPLLSTTLNL